MTPEENAFWERFKAETGETGEPFEIDWFGDDPQMADELLALVLIRQKQATCCLARQYGDRPPRTGDLSIIQDGRRTPACVIRTTSVEIKPITEADAQFAWDEGEGDRSFDWWLTEHEKYWRREAAREGFEYAREMEAVFERFVLVWAPAERLASAAAR